MCRWRKDHPPHFVAKPSTRSDGSSNLFEWDIKIPARPQSYWYPGIYSGKMTFTRDYPERPPKVTFNKIAGEPLYHPNVYLDGGVCLSIINPPESNHHYGRGGTWKPNIDIKQVLLALQLFLDEATSLAAGREESYRLYQTNRAEYERRVKRQVQLAEKIPGTEGQ